MHVSVYAFECEHVCMCTHMESFIQKYPEFPVTLTLPLGLIPGTSVMVSIWIPLAEFQRTKSLNTSFKRTHTTRARRLLLSFPCAAGSGLTAGRGGEREDVPPEV